MLPNREATASDGKTVVHSTATGEDIIKVFKVALQDKILIRAHILASSVLGKRSAPGDLVVGSNGWDPAKVPRDFRKPTPKLAAERRASEPMCETAMQWQRL